MQSPSLEKSQSGSDFCKCSWKCVNFHTLVPTSSLQQGVSDMHFRHKIILVAVANSISPGLDHRWWHQWDAWNDHTWKETAAWPLSCQSARKCLKKDVWRGSFEPDKTCREDFYRHSGVQLEVYRTFLELLQARVCCTRSGLVSVSNSWGLI